MKKIWFITGSQTLYGDDTLRQVEVNSKEIVKYLKENTGHDIEFKALVKSKEEINDVFTEVNSSKECAGVIVFAHTFSPAKMWVNALSKLDKPLLHLHTQFNKAIPSNEIDMDYMNLHQSAHGDRELAHGMNVAGLKRDIVCGHYQSPKVVEGVKRFCASSLGIAASRNFRMVRFGDNMNCVAVTDGNKVLAEKQLGWTINTVGVADLVESVDQVTDAEVDALMNEYHEIYDFADNCKPGSEFYDNVRYQAKIEIGLERYLVKGNYQAFTTNFDQLTGLDQLPGLAAQRMMAKGYGFAGEGDWRTSAMTHILKVMANNEGTSFMEDYTYDYEHGVALQAHMLEICPTIGSTKPVIEVHPLGIGGKDAPARLTFEGQTGEGVAISLVELNGALRMVVNEVEVKPVPYKMPNLPVAATFWEPKPNLEVSSHAWLLAGGAHHTAFSTQVTTEQVKTFTRFYGIETIVIDEDTTIKQIEKELN
ncbi:L-arabinose isomerase [Mollicutes bacterium LVI A0039]|nr:L-arabinose isomerase [Mollicutes bacterium LVI A0039]